MHTCHLRPSAKDLFTSRLDKRIGFRCCSTATRRSFPTSKILPTNQPIPKPICDPSGQPDNKHEVFVDKGETSWSRVIKEKSCPWSREIKETSSHEELCSSDRSGQPDKHENRTTSSSWSTSWDYHAQHRQWVNSWKNWGGHGLQKFQDYHILLWSNCRVPAFENWFRKSRTTRINKLFNETYNRVNHLIPSGQESKQMIHEVGNIDLCELLDMEPKTQCNVCLSYWDIGIVYCTCGHFLRKGREENQKFIKYTMDLLCIPNYYIKKGRPHGHRYGKTPGDREYHIANSLKKKCKKKYYLGIHDRFIRDEKFRKNMIEIGRTEEICRQMDDLADEGHTHHLTPEENWRLQRLIGGFVRTKLVPIQCQSGTDLTSNKHCLPCDS